MTREYSLTERAYKRLRDDLLTCRLAPGDKLNIKEISETLGVSLGAIREALSRLTSEGFVIADERRGFRASPISVAELRDLVQVRSNIEGQCLRRSIEIGGLDWESGLVAASHRLSKTPMITGNPARLNEDYASAHEAFHTALVAACDSNWLNRLRTWLYDQSERYRYLTVPLSRKERDVAYEHEKLVQAALNRDADRAVALLGEHLAKTASVLIDSTGQEIA